MSDSSGHGALAWRGADDWRSRITPFLQKRGALCRSASEETFERSLDSRNFGQVLDDHLTGFSLEVVPHWIQVQGEGGQLVCKSAQNLRTWDADAEFLPEAFEC